MRYRLFYCCALAAAAAAAVLLEPVSGFTASPVVHPRATTRLSASTVLPPALLQLHDEQEITSKRRQRHRPSNNPHHPTTRLSASTTIPPPPHHMAWLRWQDEQERMLARKHKQQQLSKQYQSQASSFTNHPWRTASPSLGVLPMTLLANATTSAKEAWAACFTTVEGLRDTFGRNRNALWGDLDASTTRRLYKTLLPRALLELYHCHGVSSEDLAPLAYRARVAAKKYARERSVLPARIAASVFDGVRQFCKYGTFQASGMSYRQLWDKYATQILQETSDFGQDDEEDEEHDLTSRVCYRILQKSCETNKRIDSVLASAPSAQHDLQDITRRLEQDVYDLLDHGKAEEDHSKWAIRRYKILRTLLRIRRQMEGLAYNEEKDNDLAMQAIIEDALVESKD